MEPLTTPIAPDVQYILDGAVESGHLTGGAHVLLWLYGDRKTLMAICDHEPPGNRTWDNSTGKVTLDLEEYAQSILGSVTDPGMRSAIEGTTSASFIRAVAQYSEALCYWTFEDAIWGGGLIHRHETRGRRGRINKRLVERLHSTRLVRRAVRLHRGEQGLSHITGLWDRIGRQLPPVRQAGFEMLNEMFQAQAVRMRQHYRRMEEEVSRRAIADQPDDVRVFLKKRRVTLKPIKQRRRPVIRAAATAAAILGASTVSAFARGEAVSIPAGDITFQVSPSKSIFGSGHGALKVDLLKPEGGFLSSLCVYQDAPTLDQLASIALHAMAGCAADIIATGNLYNYSADAFAHPLLAPKKKTDIEVVREAHLAGMIESGGHDEAWALNLDNYEVQRFLVKEYEKTMLPIYRERLFIEVMGRQAKAALKMFHEFIYENGASA